MDIDNLYREEIFTDKRAASVRRMTPIKVDGTDDADRPVLFIGDTTLVTQVGPLPVQFQIEADTLEEAFNSFPEGVNQAIERLNERAKEMAREEASRIVVPSGGMPPAGGPGGMPGPGGKIVLK
ncbi:MAG: hypothetical protein GY771_09570 [bacterium]|nr:hypothetical protein [bacterium]